VNEKEKFRVYPGAHKDRLAVQVAKVIAEEDD
jgi:flagellar motor switch protein FliM